MNEFPFSLSSRPIQKSPLWGSDSGPQSGQVAIQGHEYLWSCGSPPRVSAAEFPHIQADSTKQHVCKKLLAKTTAAPPTPQATEAAIA